MATSDQSSIITTPLETSAEALSEVALEDKSVETQPKLPSPAKPTKSTTIEDLPNELLKNIFKYCDAPQPSSTKLNDEPIFAVTQSEGATLKAISLVSKRWRKAILPKLFEHARLVLTAFWVSDRVGSIETVQFFQFLGQNSISEIVKTLAVCVPGISPSNRNPGNDPLGVDSFWQAIFDNIDPVELLIVAPAEALGCLSSCFVETMETSSFDCPFHYLRLRQPAPTSKFSGKGKETSQSENRTNLANPMENVPQESDLHDQEDVADPPESVPDISLWPGGQAESWMEPRVPADHSPLFDIRPWSSLLINEGSFIKAYSTYNDGASKRPPSILCDLVGAPDDEFAEPTKALISPSIRELSYVGIFPMTRHFGKLASHLPRVDTFYVQLVPRNDILDDEKKMEYVDADELWHQRNACYAAVMRELFNVPPTGNYVDLREFESGDVADTDAWHMAVEFVRRAGTGLGWRVARDGVFVRDPKVAETALEVEGSAASSSFQGKLIRWAWAGTGRLPVSAMDLYI